MFVYVHVRLLGVGFSLKFISWNTLLVTEEKKVDREGLGRDGRRTRWALGWELDGFERKGGLLAVYVLFEWSLSVHVPAVSHRRFQAILLVAHWTKNWFIWGGSKAIPKAVMYGNGRKGFVNRLENARWIYAKRWICLHLLFTNRKIQDFPSILQSVNSSICFIIR